MNPLKSPPLRAALALFLLLLAIFIAVAAIWGGGNAFILATIVLSMDFALVFIAFRRRFEASRSDDHAAWLMTRANEERERTEVLYRKTYGCVVGLLVPVIPVLEERVAKLATAVAENPGDTSIAESHHKASVQLETIRTICGIVQLGETAKGGSTPWAWSAEDGPEEEIDGAKVRGGEEIKP